MKTVLAVAVVLSSAAAFACGNSLHERAPPSPGARALVAARRALAGQKFEEALARADDALIQGLGRNQKRWAVRVKGESLLQLERPQDALPLLQSLLTEFPDDPVFLSRLAQAELQNGLTSGGTRLEALATDGTLPDARAWFWLAKARQAKGATERAVEAAQKASQLAPKDAQATRLLEELGASTKTALR